MLPVAISLLLALRQLAEPAVLRILAKSLAASLAAFVLAGWGGYWLIDNGLAWMGLSDALFTGAGPLREVAAALMVVIGLWLTWRIVAMAAIQFFADEVVAAVEARHYPHAATSARDPSLWQQARASLASAGRALLVNLAVLPVALALFFTGFGPALVFFLANAWLLGRELQDMVWQRHGGSAGHAAPITPAQRLLLGGAIAALLALPFVNFLAPVLGAASAAHLIHRKKSL